MLSTVAYLRASHESCNMHRSFKCPGMLENILMHNAGIHSIPPEGELIELMSQPGAKAVIWNQKPFRCATSSIDGRGRVNRPIHSTYKWSCYPQKLNEPKAWLLFSSRSILSVHCLRHAVRLLVGSLPALLQSARYICAGLRNAKQSSNDAVPSLLHNANLLEAYLQQGKFFKGL